MSSAVGVGGSVQGKTQMPAQSYRSSQSQQRTGKGYQGMFREEKQEHAAAAAWWRAEPNTSDFQGRVSDRIKLKTYTQPSTIDEKCASTG